MRCSKLLAGLLAAILAGCSSPPAPAADAPGPQPTACADPCERLIAADDAFEPAVAVHGNAILAAYTPFVDGTRQLRVAVSRDAGATWNVSTPLADIAAAFPGCVEVFDAGAAFLGDGTMVVTAIAGNADGLGRVLFAVDPLTGTTAQIEPPAGGCVENNIPDFARLAAAPDGLVITWRHLALPRVPPSPPGIGWSRTSDGRTWTPAASLQLAGDARCLRASVGPTPLVVGASLIVASQTWDLGIRNCVVTSVDDAWRLGNAVDLGPSPIAWATPVALGDDVLVVGAQASGDRQVPTVWRRSAGWAPEPVPGTASDGSTTPAAAASSGRLLVTSFLADADAWRYVATAWNGTWQTPVRLDVTPIVEHAMGIAGMGHYMGLAPEGDGFRAVWVAGEEGERRLVTAHVP